MAKITLDFCIDRPGFALNTRATIPLMGLTALIGPSGSGKSSLLSAMAGLKGVLSGGIAPADIDISLMFQDARLLPHMTVAAHFDFLAKTGVLSKEWDHERAESDLGDIWSKAPDQLSGGERKRAAFHIAIARKADIVLLDEPFDGLDHARQFAMEVRIEEEARRRAILLVSHDYQTIAKLVDRAVVITDQQLVGPMDVGAAFALATDHEGQSLIEPGSLLTTELLEEGPLTTLRVGNERLYLPERMVSSGGPIALRILARDVAIATEKPTGTSIQNILEATVDSVEAIVETPFMTVTACVAGTEPPQTLAARITSVSAENLKLAKGQTVWMLVKSASLEPRS